MHQADLILQNGFYYKAKNKPDDRILKFIMPAKINTVQKTYIASNHWLGCQSISSHQTKLINDINQSHNTASNRVANLKPHK